MSLLDSDTAEPVPSLGPVHVPTPESDPELHDPGVIGSTVFASVLVIVIVVIVIVVVAAVITWKRRKFCRPTKTDETYEQVNEPNESHFIPPPPPPAKGNDRLVLVIYSPDSPENDQHLALQNLVHDLSNYCMVECHDCTCIRQSVPSWLQEELQRASTVLCVCNAQFQREWDRETTSPFPLVASLRELAYGLLNQSISLSTKFAVVLLRESDRKHIPCGYLHGTRTFLVTDVEDITYFVTRTPKYAHT